MFLVPAFLLAALSSLRLCRLAAASDPRLTTASAPNPPEARASTAEAAYLAGGPERVVDVTLLDMTGRGLLHIAHTGWTSVARPVPDTQLESEVIAALGPDGQRRTEEVRREVAVGPSVVTLARSLAEVGLAVSPGTRAAMAQAVMAVRVALLATVALGTTALATVGVRNLLTGAHESLLEPAAWFLLPLILTAGTLLMARAEFHPVTPWAAPAGQQLLRALSPGRRNPDPLTTVTFRGPRALRDARLRAGLTIRSRR
ncbi:TIGR04222 domain-containing membrane protein [Streptacidiphilus jiangxiensis]|uniref:TIGR04222 domain-containing membrane protein n=1 Tax=Streptacidiphilus jiangxiensis TaxID=235985 RepID=UPI001FD5F544|nr:TIGR04222 domain-containing membrane protein [Streptacidiphilus jiangxiensis]